MRMVDLHCASCDAIFEALMRTSDEQPPACRTCGAETERIYLARTPTLRPDDIPGGILIEHGLCNADGSPRRFYSHSEIRQACAVKNLIPWGDVYSEDRTKDARVKADWQRSGEAQRQKQMRDEARRERRR